MANRYNDYRFAINPVQSDMAIISKSDRPIPCIQVPFLLLVDHFRVKFKMVEALLTHPNVDHKVKSTELALTPHPNL
jgi:hypothetical protein